ncbi:hypothetical protein N4R57_00105 [Rhodobacteraceae bacterium D3-12]|nr:hypothetical protein N4R57_00105 [Rhodobacteraceae bacterium D3-12]
MSMLFNGLHRAGSASLSRSHFYRITSISISTEGNLCDTGAGRADFGRLNCGLEIIMNKLSIIAAAAALAVATAAPVAAETKTQDPFVSTQGALGLGAAGAGVAAVAAVALAIAITTSDDS